MKAVLNHQKRMQKRGAIHNRFWLRGCGKSAPLATLARRGHSFIEEPGRGTKTLTAGALPDSPP
jgi:predicted ATPase